MVAVSLFLILFAVAVGGWCIAELWLDKNSRRFYHENEGEDGVSYPADLNMSLGRSRPDHLVKVLRRNKEGVPTHVSYISRGGNRLTAKVIAVVREGLLNIILVVQRRGHPRGPTFIRRIPSEGKVAA